MKRLTFSIVLAGILCGFVKEKDNVYPVVKNNSFGLGEVLEFKMNYSFFTVGKGSARIQPKHYKFNERDCYKVDIVAQTVGMVSWVSDVDDYFGAYIDTAALVPHQFIRKVREGKYKHDEWTTFDHVNDKIEVKSMNHKTGKMKEPKMYDAPDQVRDMIGGFLYLRAMDLSKVKPRDTIKISGFFEDSLYHLKIIYKGRETIKTKVGKVRTLVFVPVMPDNKLFDGENSITAWFSDDRNRIPVKINAEMFIGSAGVELTNYSGLKNPLNIAKR